MRRTARWKIKRRVYKMALVSGGACAYTVYPQRKRCEGRENTHPSVFLANTAHTIQYTHPQRKRCEGSENTHPSVFLANTAHTPRARCSVSDRSQFAGFYFRCCLSLFFAEQDPGSTAFLLVHGALLQPATWSPAGGDCRHENQETEIF